MVKLKSLLNELSPQAQKIGKETAKDLEKAIQLHQKIVEKNPTAKNEKDLANLIKYYIQGSTGSNRAFYKKKYPKYFNYSTKRFKKDAFKHRLESVNEVSYSFNTNDKRDQISPMGYNLLRKDVITLKDAVKYLERSVKKQHQSDTHHDLIYLLTRAHEAYKNSKK